MAKMPAPIMPFTFVSAEATGPTTRGGAAAFAMDIGPDIAPRALSV